MLGTIESDVIDETVIEELKGGKVCHATPNRHDIQMTVQIVQISLGQRNLALQNADAINKHLHRCSKTRENNIMPLVVCHSNSRAGRRCPQERVHSRVDEELGNALDQS